MPVRNKVVVRGDPTDNRAGGLVDEMELSAFDEGRVASLVDAG